MAKTDKKVYMTEAEIYELLGEMEKDANLLTERGFADKVFETDEVSFSEKHMVYLRNHPKVDPQYYLSNLRTMIKIRSRSGR